MTVTNTTNEDEDLYVDNEDEKHVDDRTPTDNKSSAANKRKN